MGGRTANLMLWSVRATLAVGRGGGFGIATHFTVFRIACEHRTHVGNSFLDGGVWVVFLDVRKHANVERDVGIAVAKMLYPRNQGLEYLEYEAYNTHNCPCVQRENEISTTVSSYCQTPI